MAETGLDEEQAERLLNESAGDLRLALVMFETECDVDTAKAALAQANGVVKDCCYRDSQSDLILCYAGKCWIRLSTSCYKGCAPEA